MKSHEPDFSGMLPFRILVAEDSLFERKLLLRKIQKWGYFVEITQDGEAALKAFRRTFPDMVITDLSMPLVSGMEFIRRIRRESLRYVYIIVLSGTSEKTHVVGALESGADDYLVKPFHPEELRTRILAGTRLLRLQSQNLLLEGMAKLVDYRSQETGNHLERVRESTLVLGETYASLTEQPASREWIELVASMSVLHDVGKVGIPDGILNKPGRLTEDEIKTMRTHPAIGGAMLEELFQKTGFPQLEIARNIVLYHHEHYDGSGYPRGLRGEEIPLPARIVAVADVYDALRSQRPYKVAMSHEECVRRILRERGKQFDPQIVEAFSLCKDRLDDIHKQFADSRTLGLSEKEISERKKRF